MIRRRGPLRRYRASKFASAKPLFQTSDGMHPALLRWFRSGDEAFPLGIRAPGSGAKAGFGTDLDRGDSGGRLERFRGAIGTIPGGAFHELGPDRQGGTRAFEIEFAVVVIAYP